MNTCGIALALVAGLALSACVIAPTKTTETQPMPKSAIDTSWKLDKGFNLDEAKALIEFCTALDYGVDVPPDYAGVAEPANAAGWEEIYPLREKLPANGVPQAIGPYRNAWKLYRKINSDIYVVAIRGTIDTKGSIVSDLIATSTPAQVQIQHRCRHADPIPHARDAQRPEFAVGLRYKHSSDWLWPVSLLPERKRQFSQPSLDPVCLDVREVLAIDPRRALVGAALGIGMRQNILAADLVVQGIEAIAGFCLRFRV